VRIVVDNSLGDDAAFAEEIARELRARELEVEIRLPDASAMFDTSVHNVASGIGIRVSEKPDRALLGTIETVVRGALQHRGSQRRRARSVPVYLGDTVRVLEWIDIFDQ
jgi:hypothetical protein